MRKYLSALLPVLLFTVSGQAQEMPLVKKVSEAKPLTPIKRVEPKYPSSAARVGREGWVKVSMVVDTDGTVKDVVVLDSMGGKGFEREALKAVQSWQYSPAEINGEKIEQCSTVQLDFRLADTQGISRRGRSALNAIDEAIKTGELQKAGELIDGLKDDTANSLEYAYLGWYAADYARAIGDMDLAQSYLKSATAIHYKQKNGEFVGEFAVGDAGFALAMQLFALQANSGNWFNAAETATRVAMVEGADSQPVVAKMQAQVQKFKAFKGNLPIELTLSERASIYHKLYQPKFVVTNPKGRIDNLEIRCDRKHETYTFAPDTQWEIPESWGGCGVLLTGEPGAALTLVEISE